MKKFMLASVALSAFAGAAVAADLPVRRAPPAPAFVAVPVFTWTGLYAGVNAGYGFAGDDRVSSVGVSPAGNTLLASNAIVSSAKVAREGFVGGGQIGYNYQFGSVVLGLETDIQYTDLAKTTTSTSGGLYSSYRSTNDYLGTVRGRVGYAWDRFMLYATGGMAYGDVYNRHFAGVVGSSPALVGAKDGSRVGYAVGAGIEYAIPAFNWGSSAATVKVEYLYYDLGDRNFLVRGATSGVPAIASRFQNDGHLVRAGLNYKFSSF